MQMQKACIKSRRILKVKESTCCGWDDDEYAYVIFGALFSQILWKCGCGEIAFGLWRLSSPKRNQVKWRLPFLTCKNVQSRYLMWNKAWERHQQVQDDERTCQRNSRAVARLRFLSSQPGVFSHSQLPLMACKSQHFGRFQRCHIHPGPDFSTDTEWQPIAHLGNKNSYFFRAS